VTSSSPRPDLRLPVAGPTRDAVQRRTIAVLVLSQILGGVSASTLLAVGGLLAFLGTFAVRGMRRVGR
jgi:hypothetical protein